MEAGRKKQFEELDPRLREAFAKLDINGNGLITKEEIKEVFKKTGRKWESVDDIMFQKTDEDGDGKIEVAEQLWTSDTTSKNFYMNSKIM